MCREGLREFQVGDDREERGVVSTNKLNIKAFIIDTNIKNIE